MPDQTGERLVDAERALDRLSRLQVVRTALSEALTPAQVAAVVMDQGISALGAAAGAIVLPNASGTTVDVVAISGYSDAVRKQFSSFPRSAPLPVNGVLASGQAFFAASLEELQQTYPGLPTPEIRGAAAAVPLIVNGHVTGAMVLSFDHTHVFDAEERELLVALATQCAQALERARLYELAVQTQEDLRRSRDQLVAILAGIAEGVIVQDAQGKMIYANEVAAHMTGFESAAELLAQPLANVLARFTLFDEHGQALPAERLPARRVLQGQTTEELVVQFRDQVSGEWRWSIVDASSVSDDEGRLQLVVSIFRDITERKRQADATAFLAAASSVLNSTLDADAGLAQLAELAVSDLADWCIVDVVDHDGHLRRQVVAHADPARHEEAEVLRRQDPRDIVAGTVGRVLRSGYSELVADMNPTTRARLATESERMRVVDAIDARSWISAPMHVRGRTLGIITVATTGTGRRFTAADQAVIEDVAARAALAIENGRLFREAQEQAEHQAVLNAAMRSTIDERDRALADLQQALRTRDEFLASASHDLKNPLGSIKATAQLLQRRLDRAGEPEELERWREGLARIDAIASRAAGLVDELLDLARMQMGQPLELERTPTDLVRLAREALAEQQHATERHTLELDAAEPELIGEWDARRMGRVLTNLVDNAVKYSPAGGTVVVRVRREQANAVLEVEDSGIGVPAADVSRIFDRFQRGSNVEGRVEGTGIGLASARHFVESHGGTIEVESQEHAGSVFRIRLPLSGMSS